MFFKKNPLKLVIEWVSHYRNFGYVLEIGILHNLGEKLRKSLLYLLHNFQKTRNPSFGYPSPVSRFITSLNDLMADILSLTFVKG